MDRRVNVEILHEMQECSARATRLADDVVPGVVLARDFDSADLETFVEEVQAAQRSAEDLRDQLDDGDEHLEAIVGELIEKYDCAADSAKRLVDFGKIYLLTKADIVENGERVDMHVQLLNTLGSTAWNLLVFAKSRHVEAINYGRYVTSIFECPAAA